MLKGAMVACSGFVPPRVLNRLCFCPPQWLRYVLGAIHISACQFNPLSRLSLLGLGQINHRHVVFSTLSAAEIQG
jgi:hypothetical protein